MKYYTGIGSRNIPDEYRRILATIASLLEGRGYILRSGGAGGSDSAFESGVINPSNKEIYLPYKNFNKSSSNLYLEKLEHNELAKSEIRKIHPNPYALRGFSLLAHTRNYYQVFGLNANTPSEFLICYTENGLVKGGSATAINLAKNANIPVFNIGSDEDLVKLKIFIKSMENNV